MKPPPILERPPSPEARAWAGLATVLLNAAVLLMAAAWALDRFVPPQHLPWKPLRLEDPVGLATWMKFDRVKADPVRCRAFLREGGVPFAEEPERTSGEFCSTRNAVRLTGGSRLAPAAPVMSCPVAAAYAMWRRHALQPAARAELGSQVARVEHYGTYACRRLYGGADGRPSEHATANALDVAGFTLADGRRVTVAGHWAQEDAEARFLRRARDGACRPFNTTLSPDYNAAHRDHLHLDQGRFRVCR